MVELTKVIIERTRPDKLIVKEISDKVNENLIGLGFERVGVFYGSPDASLSDCLYDVIKYNESLEVHTNHENVVIDILMQPSGGYRIDTYSINTTSEVYSKK